MRSGYKLRNFNSIKVRLKLDDVDSCVYLLAFQFHKGTIKTGKRLVHETLLLQFQFHKGTIKTRWKSARYSVISISIP